MLNSLMLNPFYSILGFSMSESLPQFHVGDSILDSLDLKVSILGQGIYVNEEVYTKFERSHRLSRHFRSCNTMFLGDNLPVYLARTGPESPFHLVVRYEKPAILYNGEFVTEVSFPPKTSFFAQKTSSGRPFGEYAVIQGWDMLAFSYLWPCSLAISGNPCRFCHAGNATLQAVEAKQWADFQQTPQDVAEVVKYAVETDPNVKILQLTAGSTLNADAEIERYVEILNAIDKAVGIEKIPPIIFLTPPSDFKLLDKLFDAGVGKIACDMDIWSEEIFNEFCPGKAKYTSRQRHLDALLYIADKYGPNRACSVFVAGLEPIGSLLEGSAFLAKHGIVPLPSPWMRFGVERDNLPKAPGLDYYRTLRQETAKLYIEHELVVPGTVGSSVCLSRDVWLRRETLARCTETVL